MRSGAPSELAAPAPSRGPDLQPRQHFRRPPERPFTAEERGRVTILFGGLTWKHEKLIQAVFESNGYRCQILPPCRVADFQLGKEYGNVGQCSPIYFTCGNLVRFLQQLEAQGLSGQQILDEYVFFTAGSCGPCRFGMYEAEYRLALRNAGFDGFRVLLFQQQAGLKADTGERGLKFTADFALGAINALLLGDVLYDLSYRIRPYEVNPGETDRVLEEVADHLGHLLRSRERFEILERTPAWLSRWLARKGRWKKTANVLGKIREHMYGNDYQRVLRECRERIDRIEVDRTRVKPVVKITGEFWAQTTESDGNYNMFAFLEREGAQVVVEPIGTWVMYLLYQAKARLRQRKSLDAGYHRPVWSDLGRRLGKELGFRKKWLLFGVGESFWSRQYQRAAALLGGITPPLVPQEELARLAEPFYNPFARGGEGHLEVAKNVYYTMNKRCHMVLALKPFGCLPSSQSDGVQAAVANYYKDMIFLPIETSGEGEISAHSRVQMALGEAKAKAKAEFHRALRSTGKPLEEIKTYVADHPELRRPFYRVPRRKGVAGVAANFVLHVSDLIDGKGRPVPERARKGEVAA